MTPCDSFSHFLYSFLFALSGSHMSTFSIFLCHRLLSQTLSFSLLNFPSSPAQFISMSERGTDLRKEIWDPCRGEKMQDTVGMIDILYTEAAAIFSQSPPQSSAPASPLVSTPSHFHRLFNLYAGQTRRHHVNRLLQWSHVLKHMFMTFSTYTESKCL